MSSKCGEAVCKLRNHALTRFAMEYFQDLANNSQRPSIFELVAQDQLRDLLQPALKYVLSVRASLCARVHARPTL